MTRSVRLTALLLVAAVAGAAPVLAKRNDPNVHLRFAPQQSVATTVANLSEEMLTRPVEIRLRDARPGADPARIGTRTDDDDRRINLVAVDEVASFVERALSDTAGRWGIHDESGALLVLEISLLTFQAVETNQAVGATFNAEVRLGGKLLDRAEKVLWSGSASGDATRYGKKFSNANVNEVLSDALLEAFGTLLDDRGLHDAWAGRARR